MTNAIGLSRAQIGDQNFKRLEAYLAEADRNGTLPWGTDGRLIRKTINDALGFGRSVLLQNPRCAALISRYEGGQREVDQATNRAAGQRSPEAAADKQRIKDLEARLVTVEEENRYLKDQMRRQGYADLQLPDIGRLPW